MIICKLKLFLSFVQLRVPKGYHSGGASYVLSQESLRRFYDAHKDPKSECRKDGGSEDIEIAKCLRTKGVYPGKSLDKQNRELFHPLSPAAYFRDSLPAWLSTFAENPPQRVSLLKAITFVSYRVCFLLSITIVAVIKLYLFIMLLP